MKASPVYTEKRSFKPKRITLKETGERDPVLRFAQRYHAFFNSTNDGIAIFNPNGDILDANPRLLKLCGYSYDIIVSKKLDDIFDEESCEKLKIQFRLLIEGRERKKPIECLESVLIPRSGRRRPVEISLSLLKNQYGFSKTILAVIRDLTKRKEIEARFIQRAEELQKVFDAVPTILAVFDGRRRIKRINQAGLNVFQKLEKEVIGERIGDALNCVNRHDSPKGCGFGPRCRKCAIRESMLRCLRTGHTVLGVEQLITREGFENPDFYFKINVVPLETMGKRWGVISIDDITERKKREKEAIELHNSISRANLELKKTLEDLAKSQFQLLESQKLEQIGLLASGFAHNLKSPLSGIKGYAELLSMDHKDMRELDMIISEVEKMESIINNLMLKSRRDHENKEEMLNLNDLIKIELEFLSANMFFKHRVKKKIHLDKNLPSVSGVYAHFSQAIVNIIQNSLDAMYNVKKKVLTINTRHDDQYIYIDISDTGCGIPEEIQDKVFEVFFTTKPLATERKGEEPFGTGLGLSTANYFIRQYGGKISIESEVGKGTTVTIQIPHVHKKKSKSTPRVLVVDDSESMVDIVTQICDSMGIETYGATDGEKALELYRKWKPDVVVSDLCMAGLSGPEMMTEIRKLNPSQRVVYMSGYLENPEFQEWLTKEQEQPYLCTVVKKPFSLENFRDILYKMVFDHKK